MIPWRSNVVGGNTIFEQYFCSWLSLFPKTVKILKWKTFSEFISQPKMMPGPLKPEGGQNEHSLFRLEDQPSNYVNTKAELRLYLDIEEEPDYLEFDENEHFDITPKKIIEDLGKGKRFWKSDSTVSIVCKSEFYKDQKINIYAVKKDSVTGEDVKKLAGRLYVWENYPARRKKRKVVLVPVLTSTNPSGKAVNDEKDRINKYLRQALLELDDSSLIVPLDISGVTDFGGFIDSGTSRIKKTNGTQSLQSYLKAKLRGQEGDTYNAHFKAFYFKEDGYSVNGLLSGYSAFNADFEIVFNSANEQTASHEFLHSLNLAHSFSNIEASSNAKYTYKYPDTDNLMDYSHHQSGHDNDRSCLWHWQWIIANDSTT